MNRYNPEPIDTSDVVLSEEMMQLRELLAENVHDAWANQRMQEGWQYGAQRNDEKKTHPSLVPYEMLSAQEKDYDRLTVTQTLKVILKMGYTISKDAQ